MRLPKLFYLLTVAGMCSCTSNPPAAVHPGKTLAATYCASCHALPEPSLLDSATWHDHVLPHMANFLGIYPEPGQRAALLHRPDSLILQQAGIYPERAVLAIQDFLSIQDYYLKHAPKQLPYPELTLARDTVSWLKPEVPAFRFGLPGATFIQIQPGRGLILGHVHTGSMYDFGPKLDLRQVAQTGEGPAWSTPLAQSSLVTVLGSFSPTDEPGGKLVEVAQTRQVVISGLKRPVHHAVADLNQDNRPDIVVCEYGKWTGGLSWWENMPSGPLKKHVLRAKSGATRVFVRDLNADGKPDLLALFAQGDEGIFAYLNQGNGQFEEKCLIRFPSSYGSSFLDLADFDGDGREELIYAAGDNADYPPVVKPYHGIRINALSPDLSLKELHFLPLPGAYGAEAADFDLDGDMDLAAISFFPDFTQTPWAGAVLFTQTAPGQFECRRLQEQSRGRWIVMDAGDLDGDGDTDLALGSMAFEVVPAHPVLDQWVSEGISFMVWRNTLR
jgi:hypothetical protein